ncbi:MAG: hypothetical protein AABX01_06410 [Candidatus Micrarchaeota archaeon]
MEEMHPKTAALFGTLRKYPEFRRNEPFLRHLVGSEYSRENAWHARDFLERGGYSKTDIESLEFLHMGKVFHMGGAISKLERPPETLEDLIEHANSLRIVNLMMIFEMKDRATSAKKDRRTNLIESAKALSEISKMAAVASRDLKKLRRNPLFLKQRVRGWKL